MVWLATIAPLAVVLIIILALAGLFVVRPIERCLVERFGKYNRFSQPGLHWRLPLIEKLYFVNITEQMVDAEPQEIITNDNLNARVDAQIYFKVKNDEISIKDCQYNVNAYKQQIVSLARTTLRNIIGTLTLKSANPHERNGELGH